MDLVLLGAPGSGKGTLAAYLEAALNLKHIASGDLFRDNLKNRTPLGLRAEEYMTSGSLVPDEVTIAMLRERLDRPDAQKGVLLDGFPRTMEQAIALSEMIETLGRRVDGVVYWMYRTKFSSNVCQDGSSAASVRRHSTAPPTRFVGVPTANAPVNICISGPTTRQIRFARGWQRITVRPNR